jgi:hypothetical protein
MKGFVRLIFLLFLVLSFNAEAGINGGYSIEIIRDVTIGEYFMIAFLTMTLTMYLFYLLDVHLIKRGVDSGEGSQELTSGSSDERN